VQGLKALQSVSCEHLSAYDSKTAFETLRNFSVLVNNVVTVSIFLGMIGFGRFWTKILGFSSVQ